MFVTLVIFGAFGAIVSLGEWKTTLLKPTVHSIRRMKSIRFSQCIRFVRFVRFGDMAVYVSSLSGVEVPSIASHITFHEMVRQAAISSKAQDTLVRHNGSPLMIACETHARAIQK